MTAIAAAVLLAILLSYFIGKEVHTKCVKYVQMDYFYLQQQEQPKQCVVNSPM